MRSRGRTIILGWLVPLGALLMHAQGQAQIYTCVAADGSRVFSDERCGPDAKVVPNISTQKRAPASASSKPKTPARQRSAAELDALSKQCDAGDNRACADWTLGGGPKLLKENEHKAEMECEAGSLAACEERYCAEGLSEDCRLRVLRTAELAGEIWYLRADGRRPENGVTKYDVRCVPKGAPLPRDVSIICASEAGPNRCYRTDPQQGFARLDQAATKYCSL